MIYLIFSYSTISALQPCQSDSGVQSISGLYHHSHIYFLDQISVELVFVVHVLLLFITVHSEEFKCISLYIYMYFFLSELPVLYGPNVFCKICSTKVHVKLFKRNGFIEKLLHLFTYSRSRIIIISFLVCKNWELLPFSYINSGNQQSCCPYF